MKTLIAGGTIVNEGRAVRGNLLIDGERIEGIGTTESPRGVRVIDATGCYVLPGVIDSHVHFREPGLTDKACIESESRAAAAGGVTTFFDMPNTVPQTTTLEALREKFALAARDSHVNYSFFFGATASNTGLFAQLDRCHIPGIKLFMGSSTGNMLVDGDEALHRVFRRCASVALPVMAHCEDTALVNANMAYYKEKLDTNDPDVALHPMIRSREACCASTERAVALAKEHGARLHVAHISTAEELALIEDGGTLVTAEATVGHLLFSSADYATLGTRIKVNPAIKEASDRDALRQALSNGLIATVATDHAPHLLAQKEGGSARAASGMPMVQFSLVAMLGLVDEGVITLERLVELMAHNPATLFSVARRGFLRPGYQADIAIVRRGAPWTLTASDIESRCAWSPLEGRTFSWRVEHTLCNGHLVYTNGTIDRSYTGQAVEFRQ